MADTISKDTMRRLLAKLAEEMTLVGPVDKGKVIEFDKTDADTLLMDDRVSYKSAKEYYFPQTERILSFTEDEAMEKTDMQPTVIFGCKPCDFEAMRVMQAVFMEGRYKDPFFQRHMDANLLIGVGCIDMKNGCFCDKLGIDKTFSDFGDIMLEDKGDSYEVTHLSDKGREALAKLDETKGIDCDNSRQAVAMEKELGLDVETQDAAMFDAADWEQLTETCQGCGICTYICPTCHCFEFKDVEKGGEVGRYRCWDSCMYPKFTLHASGHNPRATRYERYRQRLLHKYLYVPKNTGYIACTGCGRCIRSCPAGMSIRTVLEAVMEVQP